MTTSASDILRARLKRQRRLFWFQPWKWPGYWIRNWVRRRLEARSSNFQVRRRMREDAFYRKIMPPLALDDSIELPLCEPGTHIAKEIREKKNG